MRPILSTGGNASRLPARGRPDGQRPGAGGLAARLDLVASGGAHAGTQPRPRLGARSAAAAADDRAAPQSRCKRHHAWAAGANPQPVRVRPGRRHGLQTRATWRSDVLAAEPTVVESPAPPPAPAWRLLGVAVGTYGEVTAVMRGAGDVHLVQAGDTLPGDCAGHRRDRNRRPAAAARRLGDRPEPALNAAADQSPLVELPRSAEGFAEGGSSALRIIEKRARVC